MREKPIDMITPVVVMLTAAIVSVGIVWLGGM
jgi:hypothetical protein